MKVHRLLVCLVSMLLISIASSQSSKFRSGIFLRHSTGGCIWGIEEPKGDTMSVPREMAAYNLQRGLTGQNAVSLREFWWPVNDDNEWEIWHRIFENRHTQEDIRPILGTNRIVIIKSCFPSSAITSHGTTADTLAPTLKTIWNYKWHWRSILKVMKQRPMNFFVIWTNAPLVASDTRDQDAVLSDQFCRWAKDTLAQGLDAEFGTFPANVYVFDFFHKLAGPDGKLPLKYAWNSSDSHPNSLATQLVAPQFVSEVFNAALSYETLGSNAAVTPVLISPPTSATGVTTNPTLRWNASGGATSYRLQISISSDFSLTVCDQSSLTDTSQTISGLANSTIYYWRVNATNSSSTSAWSQVWTFATIVAAPVVPTLASPPDSARRVSITPIVSWTRSMRATTYRLQISLNPAFATTVVNDSTIADTTKIAGPLQNNVIYFWRVSAKNDGGTSSWSSVRSFTTIAAAPQVPVPAIPADSARNVQLNCSLSWSSVGDAISYHVQLSTSPSFSSYVLEDSSWTTTSRAVGPLSPARTYYWRVRAKNEGGTSDWSEARSFTTIVAAPQAPALAAPADSAINVQVNTILSWSAVSDATVYHLQVSTATTFASLSVDDTTLNTTSRSIGPLSLATSYYWRARAKNQGGWGPYSPVRRFSTISTTSIDQVGSAIPTEYALSQNYPNPFNPATSIQFALPKSTYVTLKVFDALGKEVTTLITQGLEPGYFMVRWQGNVPSGIYFCRLQAGEYVETKKMVLLR